MKRRGVGLLIAILVTTLVGMTISLMTLHIGQLARLRQADRARGAARILLDSGMAYAAVHRESLRANPPKDERVLPTDDLLPAPGKSRLTLRAQGDGKVRLRAVVEYGRARATEDAVVVTSPPRTMGTSPATTAQTYGGR